MGIIDDLDYYMRNGGVKETFYKATTGLFGSYAVNYIAKLGENYVQLKGANPISFSLMLSMGVIFRNVFESNTCNTGIEIKKEGYFYSNEKCRGLQKNSLDSNILSFVASFGLIKLLESRRWIAPMNFREAALTGGIFYAVYKIYQQTLGKPDVTKKGKPDITEKKEYIKIGEEKNIFAKKWREISKGCLGYVEYFVGESKQDFVDSCKDLIKNLGKSLVAGYTIKLILDRVGNPWGLKAANPVAYLTMVSIGQFVLSVIKFRNNHDNSKTVRLGAKGIAFSLLQLAGRVKFLQITFKEAVVTTIASNILIDLFNRVSGIGRKTKFEEGLND